MLDNRDKESPKDSWQGGAMAQTGIPIQTQIQWKNERFFAVMSKFSVVQSFTFLLFTGVFAYLMDWKMVWASGLSTDSLDDHLFWISKKTQPYPVYFRRGYLDYLCLLCLFPVWMGGWFLFPGTFCAAVVFSEHPFEENHRSVRGINYWRRHDRVVFSLMVYPGKNNIG